MSKTRQTGVCNKNSNGGYYHQGDSYPLWKKTEIVELFFDMWTETFPTRPSYNAVAKAAKVSHPTVKKFIEEVEEKGYISDPSEERVIKQNVGEKKKDAMDLISAEEEMFLLALHAEEPTRTNTSYIGLLEQNFGTKISSKALSQWWKHRFIYKGNFRKSNMIPKDKFTDRNWFRYYEFRMFINVLGDQTRFNFLDEKHLVNHNGEKLKARACPLTGILPPIPVDGNFRDSNNIVACISMNHRKPKHIFFTLSKERGTAKYFSAFVQRMVSSGFLMHGEVLIMDNARIHTHSDAAGIKDFLWNVEVNGKPLHVLVVYLPTRAPELNPIELIFNILVVWLRSFHWRSRGPVNQKVIERAYDILEHIDYDLIIRCGKHCGYLLEQE